jgi:hypothetical protein
MMRAQGAELSRASNQHGHQQLDQQAGVAGGGGGGHLGGEQ